MDRDHLPEQCLPGGGGGEPGGGGHGEGDQVPAHHHQLLPGVPGSIRSHHLGVLGATGLFFLRIIKTTFS